MSVGMLRIPAYNRMKLNGNPIQMFATIVAGNAYPGSASHGNGPRPTRWHSRLTGPASLNSPLKIFAAVSTGETHGMSSNARQKFLSGKSAWKSRASRKPIVNWNRMLKKAKRIVLTNALQKIGSARAAWYWVRPLNGMSPLTNVSTVAWRTLKRQTVHHRVKQQDQAENDKRQNEQIGGRIKTDSPDDRSRWIQSASSHHLMAPRVTPATMKRLARITKSTAGIAVRTLPGNRNAQSMPYCPMAL